MPTCNGPVRRAVLDQLGRCYHADFSDAWDFERFAKDEKLELDFTGAPQRP